jgi:RNA polymerase sigma factor (sigma-70 family)
VKNSPAQAINEQSTMELLIRVRHGDDEAAEALLARCLPPLKRWAHGRLPVGARGTLDTDDLVQSAVLQLLKRIDRFEPHHVGAMQAYLRQSVINRIRDEVRRVARQPTLAALPEDVPSHAMSPLERAIQNEAYFHYREALDRLRSRDRALVVGRIELQWSLDEIVERFGFRSAAAARVAVARAVRRLALALDAARQQR